MALTDNILGYWKLDNNSNDATGNGNNGTDTAMTYNTTHAKINQSATFNGTSSRISLPTSMHPTTACTCTAWVYSDNYTAGNIHILAQTDGSSAATSSYLFLVSASGGKPYIDIAQAIDHTFTHSTGLTNSTMYFLAFRYDGTNMSISINAASKESSGLTGNINSVTQGCYIGSYGSYAQYTPSGTYIDEIGFWSRSLSDAEVTSLYNSGAGFAYPFVVDPTVTTNYLKGRKRSRVDFTGVSLG